MYYTLGFERATYVFVVEVDVDDVALLFWSE